jgi:hypothetical protein
MVSPALWAVVSFAPMAAATVLPAMVFTLAAPLIPMAAVVMGTLMGTLGLAGIIGYLERQTSSIPRGDSARAFLNANRSSLPESSTQEACTLPDNYRHLRADDLTGEGLEERQRFTTQFVVPGMPHAQPVPSPIPNQPWSVTALGDPDGMAYNVGAHRGDGQRGGMVAGAIMDGMSIALASVQQNVEASRLLPQGEVYYGPLLGAWSNCLMAMGEVGFTDQRERFGLRLGVGMSAVRSESTTMDLTAPRAHTSVPWAQEDVQVTVSKTRGASCNTTPAWSMLHFYAHLRKFTLSGGFAPLVRGEYAQQMETVVSRRVNASTAQNLFGELQKPFSRWFLSTLRAWRGGTPNMGSVPDLLDPRSLIAQECVKETHLKRRGWHTSIAPLGLPVGYSRLGHAFHTLTAERVMGDGKEEQLLLKLRIEDHVSRRHFLTTYGGFGYDRGQKINTGITLSCRLNAHAAASEAYRELIGANRNGADTERLRILWDALRGTAGCYSFEQEEMSGVVRSHELGVKVFLMPSEIFSHVLPENFCMASSLRGQSAVFTRTLYDNNHKPVCLNVASQHDHVRMFGPHGTRTSRSEALVSLAQEGPTVHLSHHWAMSRATAADVHAFIHQPLAHLIGTHDGPLFGAGWRTDRKTDLTLALSKADLAILNRCGREKTKQMSAAAPTDKDAPLATQADPLSRLLQAVCCIYDAVGQGPWQSDAIHALSQAFSDYSASAQLSAIADLRDVLQHVGQHAQLHVTTTSSSYTLPDKLVRSLYLDASLPTTAMDAQIASVCDQIAACTALVLSDPLLSTKEKEDYVQHYSWLVSQARARRHAAKTRLS